MAKKIVGYNGAGDPIYEDGSSPSSVVSGGSDLTIKPPATIMDRLYEKAREYGPMISGMGGTEAGATVGGAIGGPVGAVGGGALGGMASYLLGKKAFEAGDGIHPTLTMRDLGEAGINQLFESGSRLPAVQRGVARIGDLLGDHPILRMTANHIPLQTNPETSAAIDGTLGLTRTVGEVTGSKPIQQLEMQVGGKKLVALRDTQQAEHDMILDRLRGSNKGPLEIGKEGQGTLANIFDKSKAKYKSLYEDFDKKFVQPNTKDINVVTGYGEAGPPVQKMDASGNGLLDESGNPITERTQGQPIIEPRKVELPTYFANTQKYVSGVQQDLSKLLSPDDFENLPTRLQRAYKSVASIVDEIAKPTTVQGADGVVHEVPFKEYDAIKEARTQLNKLANSPGMQGRPGALLNGLAKSLDEDINGTLQGLDPTGGAVKLRDQANLAFQQHQDTIKPLMDRVYRSNPALKRFEDPSEMFAQADSDPKVARELRAAFQGKDVNVLKTGMMAQAIDSAYDPATGTTSIDAILNKIGAPDSPYKSVMTPSELDNTTQLLRGMRTQNVAGMQSGKPIDFVGKHIAFALSGAAGGALFGHDTSSRLEGAAAGGLMFSIAPSQFVNRVLLNPEAARIIAKLPELPADSPKARLLMQTLFHGALRGTQGFLMKGDSGEQQSAHIGNDGTIVKD